MKRFVEGECRDQSVLFPERLDDWIAEDNPVRAVDAFVEELEYLALGFESAEPADTGRPAYHPGTLLKIYVYGYLNRIQSSRRLEREAQRNVELIWLTGRLAPDFKTIADFRRDNGAAIRKVCAQFVELCRGIGLFSQALVVIDGGKFKAVNNRDKNFTPHLLLSGLEDEADTLALVYASVQPRRVSGPPLRLFGPPAATSELGKLDPLTGGPRVGSMLQAKCLTAQRCGGSEPVRRDRTGIEEESEHQRTGGAHHCGKHKGCRVGARDVDEPPGHGDADDSGNLRESIAKSKHHGAVAWSDIEIARHISRRRPRECTGRSAQEHQSRGRRMYLLQREQEASGHDEAGADHALAGSRQADAALGHPVCHRPGQIVDREHQKPRRRREQARVRDAQPVHFAEVAGQPRQQHVLTPIERDVSCDDAR